jgi:hypothetical protein
MEVTKMKRRTGRTLFAAALAALAVLAPAGSAHAGLLSESADACPAYDSSKVFARWLDPFYYSLAPGGALESASGWTLSGGARIVSGNETWFVHDVRDKSSLLLPRGATATSAPMCVGIQQPTIRFFARRPNFALLPLMTVEGVFKSKSGSTVSLPFVGVPLAGSKWALQLPFVATPSVLELGDHTWMQFRFRAVTGDWQIDDVYVDPWNRR